MHCGILNHHISETKRLRLNKSEIWAQQGMMFYAAHALSMMVLYKHLDMHEKKIGMDLPPIKTNIYISPVGGHHFKKILLHLPSAAPLITKFNFEKNLFF